MNEKEKLDIGEQFVVIYFTGTGNSRYLAKLTAQMLDDSLVSANALIKENKTGDFYSDFPYVFVCPTYSWQIPQIFEKFIDGSRFSGNTGCYFIMDCGDDIGNAQKPLRQLCKRKGFQYRGVREIVMPENYIAVFSAPPEAEEKRIISAAEKELEEAVQIIRRGGFFPEKKITLTDRLKSSVVRWFFYRWIVKDKKFAVHDGCISCGTCENLCPMNNIRIVSGKPVWNGDCTHCMACICGCPAECIEYGKHTKGLRRYYLK